MALLTCVVCGRSSTRPSWNNNNVYGTTKVACDFHDQQEINWAIQNASSPSPNVVVVDTADEESPQA